MVENSESFGSFYGDTFVAFLDICGFKQMMQNPRKAEEALDNFFRIVYEEVTTSDRLNSIAVSDSAIIFARDNIPHNDPEESGDLRDHNKLCSLLACVKKIACRMIQIDVAIKGSIAYGPLNYQKRYNGPRVVKAMLLGKAYIEAYSDVENGKPKLKIGQIRLNPKSKIKKLLERSQENSSELSLLKSGNGGYYFYWMLESMEEHDNFSEEYKNKYDKMYDPIIFVLKEFVHRINVQ